MQSSSNSLLHFTKSLYVIQEILKDRFYGSYCVERFQYENQEYALPVPKISFCDVAEETIGQYEHYGKYCIGLTKEWGKRNQLNPVLYIEKHSSIAKSFIHAYNGTNIGVNLVNNTGLELRQLFDITKSHKEWDEMQKQNIYDEIARWVDRIESLGKIVSFGQYIPFYVKHYEDDLERNEKTIKNYRFYDEREWCYVPESLQTSNEMFKSMSQYKMWREESSEKSLLKNVNLDFKLQDITHLLVEKKEDIITLCNTIDNLPLERAEIEIKERLKSIIKVNPRNQE